MQEAEGKSEEAEGGGSKLKEAEKGRKRHEGSLEEAEGGLRNVFQTEAERCRRKLKDAQMVKMTTIVWRVWKKI